MSTQSGESAPPRRTGRSPSYPGIDLELAIKRAGQLWEQEHHYPTAVPTILGHWGYGAKSGGGFAALAALKSFGLLEDNGTGADRRAWLSELAQDILTAEDSATRRNLLRQAALKPPMHAMLWNSYQAQLPSDQSMQLFLTRERNFTPSGANELVSEWKRTMVFADLSSEADSLGADAGESPPADGNQNGEPTMTPPPTIEEGRQGGPSREQARTKPERTQRTIQVPYAAGEWALLQIETPISEREWSNMMASLEALKVGFVSDE